MRIDEPTIKGPLTIETVNNAVGDFLTYSGSLVVRRTASQVRTDIGATTVGSNLFQLTNPSAITFLRVNADNTVSTLSATDFRTAIGAGTSSTTGTVTSVSGTGTVSGLSLSGTVTTSGNITLSGTLSVAASNFSSQTANTFLAAPNGSAGVPTFRTIVAADVPTLNQNTTGTAAGLSSTLVVGSGGTGATTLTGVVIGNGTSAMTAVAGTASQLLRRNAGNTAYEFFTIAGSDITGAALTKTDDTNVTLTLGGTPSTALLRAASITVGWTGTLAVSRGGTGLSTLGTANQLLRVNAGATALEYFTPTFLTAAITSLNGLTAATQTFSNDTNVTITSATSTHTIGWSGQLAVGRGGTGASTLTGVVIGNGTSAMTAVAGTSSQLLRRNAGNTAYEFFTQTLGTISDVVLTTPSNGQVLQFNGTNWVNATPSGGGTITGSGTTNYITKWTGTTAIGNSLIQDTGVGIGFNTAPLFSHLFSFKVATNLNLTIDDNRFSSLSINAYSDAGSNIDLVYSALNHIFDAFGSERMRIVGSNGNVLIGTSTDNSSKLRVNGTTFIEPTSTSTNGLIVKGLASQAADVLVVQNSTGGEVFKVNSGGNVTFNGQVYTPVNAKGNSGTGTVTFDWNDGNIQTVTLTGNCTFAFSNPQSGASYQIIITQDTTGGRTITWPTIHWEGKTVPTLTGTLSSKDIVTLTYDGTNYNGVIAKNFGTP